MIPVKDLPDRDKELYYRNTVIFNKETGKAELLRNVAGNLAEIMDINGRNLHTISVERLEERYLLYRRTLGWTNAGIGCMYAYSNPGRGNRKAYSMDELVIVSPIYTDVYTVYSLRRAEVANKDPYFESKLPEDLESINNALRSIEYLKPRSVKYLSNYNSEKFFSVNEALTLLNDNSRMGCAINNSWAIINTVDNNAKESMIYYQDEPVGTIKLTTGDINFNENKDLEVAWSRV